jgi:hypothetical protein
MITGKSWRIWGFDDPVVHFEMPANDRKRMAKKGLDTMHDCEKRTPSEIVHRALYIPSEIYIFIKMF